MNIADTDIRKAVVHGVNKSPIIAKELNEAYEPAEQLFPPSLPYCDVDLTPKFAYDAEKAGWLCSGFGAAECADAEITFALLQGDAAHEAYANDIAAELKELGITVTQKPLEKDALNAAMVGGDYDMVFSETWGAPYDPHSYVKSWFVFCVGNAFELSQRWRAGGLGNGFVHTGRRPTRRTTRRCRPRASTRRSSRRT
jgi:nickel transport system substrate-binding protein